MDRESVIRIHGPAYIIYYEIENKFEKLHTISQWKNSLFVCCGGCPVLWFLQVFTCFHQLLVRYQYSTGTRVRYGDRNVRMYLLCMRHLLTMMTLTIITGSGTVVFPEYDMILQYIIVTESWWHRGRWHKCSIF